MGRGVVTTAGGSPTAAWAVRIHSMGNAQLGDDLFTLLAGHPLLSRDGTRELSVIEIRGGAFRITVRRPEAPFVADLVVVPDDEVGNRDQRSAHPAPDQWITGDAKRHLIWELFNCRCLSLTSRDNAAGPSEHAP